MRGDIHFGDVDSSWLSRFFTFPCGLPQLAMLSCVFLAIMAIAGCDPSYKVKDEDGNFLVVEVGDRVEYDGYAAVVTDVTESSDSYVVIAYCPAVPMTLDTIRAKYVKAKDLKYFSRRMDSPTPGPQPQVTNTSGAVFENPPTPIVAKGHVETPPPPKLVVEKTPPPEFSGEDRERLEKLERLYEELLKKQEPARRQPKRVLE
jgi:hypothetical protein